MSRAPKAANADEAVHVIGDAGFAAAGDPDVAVVPDEGDDTQKLPKHAVLQEDGSVILPLKFPRTLKTTNTAGGTVQETLYEQLHMHRLTGADMRAATAASAEKRVVVSIARSARIREGFMSLLYDKMDASDALAAAEVFAFFLNSGP
jgi:hypothetical protein